MMQGINNNKKELKKNKPTCFFDSTRYQYLTKVRLLTYDSLSVPTETGEVKIESASVVSCQT
jgi:hypothetical protein